MTMDYKKRFEEVFKWAKDAHSVAEGMLKEDLEHLFPELVESEDEKIRKNIKITLMSMEDNLADFYSTHRTSQKELLAWLEKQGEQKPIEWSEDDEQYLLVCKNALAKYQTTDKWDAHIISHWLENKLKSLRPQKNNWERVTKEIYFKEPVLVRRKDKSDSWEGYRVCSNYTLNPQTDERYILIKDINN